MEESKTLIVIVAVVAIVAIFGIVYLKPNAPLQSQTIAGQAYQSDRICECYLPGSEYGYKDVRCTSRETCETCCGRVFLSPVPPSETNRFPWLT